MPAPSLGLSSGISAGGDRLREMVAQQLSRQIAAAKYAEELRQKRHAEMVAEGRLGVDEFDADTRRGNLSQQLAEWKWKLANPEMVEHRGIVDPRTQRPYVELRPKQGTGPGVRLGDEYHEPETLTLNDQITPKGVSTRVVDKRDPSKILYENQQYVRPVTGSGSGNDDDTEVSGLARMVIGNPDLLKEMNPVLRGKVLGEISKNPEPFRLGRQRLLDSILGETEQAITELQEHPGMAGAVGAPALLQPGSWTRVAGLEALPGSAAAGFQAGANRLQSLLTAPRLELMRGLGAMSEREFEAMQASASKLKDRISEPEYAAELGRLLKATKEARARARQGQAGPVDRLHTPPGAPAAPAKPGAPAAPAPRTLPTARSKETLRNDYGY